MMSFEIELEASFWINKSHLSREFFISEMLILQFFLSFHVAAKKALIFGGSGEFTSSLDILHQNGTIELSDREALKSFGGGTARSYQWYDLPAFSLI